MEPQEMEIIIDKEGRITVKVSGIHGNDCLSVTRDLESVAGVVEQREYTPEYYEQPAEHRECRNISSR